MHRTTWIAALVCATVLASSPRRDLVAQITYQPTPEPIVTADNETWYLEGEPITYSGSLYYPTGPKVYFNRYEMARSGNYRGVPLFVRTMIEPYSLVYLPLAGGLMQPYERRREGELAGTAGSTTPSFPVQTASEQYRPAGVPGIAQAAGPPTFVDRDSALAATLPSRPAFEPPPAGSSGAATVLPPVGTMGPLASARRPQGLNGVFVDFDGRRWFSSGPAVPFDAARFIAVGDYHGFAVYADRDNRGGALYIAVSADKPDRLAQYAPRR
jgi:hypothetical protein